MKLDIREIEKELAGLVDENYKEGMATAVPTDWTIRGVRVPQLQDIAKGLVEKDKTEEDYKAVLGFLDRAFIMKDRELALIGLNVLYSYRKFFNGELTDKIKAWIGGVSDWEICDNIAYMIIPELILKGDFTDKDLLFLRDHENLFARRAYIVSRVKILRKGTGDTGAILEEISSFAGDRENYIVKAVSWALRSTVASAPDKVVDFLNDHQDELHPSVIREVTNKLETGKKNR